MHTTLVLDFVFRIYSFLYSIYDILLMATGLSPFVIFMFFVWCVYRFLLSPLLGSNLLGSGSDTAKKDKPIKANNKDKGMTEV